MTNMQTNHGIFPLIADTISFGELAERHNLCEQRVRRFCDANGIAPDITVRFKSGNSIVAFVPGRAAAIADAVKGTFPVDMVAPPLFEILAQQAVAPSPDKPIQDGPWLRKALAVMDAKQKA